MPNSSTWQSLYDGGLGVRLSVTTASANVAVPGAAIVSQMIITNLGSSPAFVKSGVSSSLAATIACYLLYPGYDLILPTNPFVAAITETGTTTLLINTGSGAGT